MRLNATILTVCLALFILWSGTPLQAQSPYTPKPGSPERQAICDTLRAHVLAKFTDGKLPKPVVFKISTLSVLGEFAFMECKPLFKDGTDAMPEHLPDIDYAHCFQREEKGWKVILDLTRGDVPSSEEVRQIRSSLPPGFPHSVFTPFWRDLLQKER